MKKITVLLLSLIATLTLGACGAVALHESRNDAEDLAQQVANDATAGIVAGASANEDMFAELDGDGGSGDLVVPDYGSDSVTYAKSEDSDDGEGGEDGYNDGEGLGRAMDCLIEWMLAGTFSYDFKMVMEVQGAGAEAKGSLAAEGDDYAGNIEMLMMGDKIVARVIKKGNTIYVIDDESKTILKMPADNSDYEMQAGMKTDYSNFTLIGSGTAEFAGKTLPFEDYKEATSGETVRFFLEDEQVYGIFMEVDGATVQMVITNPSDRVPEGAFDLPKGYDTYSN
jgi:predicted transcriptional regulator with HTH domain